MEIGDKDEPIPVVPAADFAFYKKLLHWARWIYMKRLRVVPLPAQFTLEKHCPINRLESVASTV